VETSCLKTNMWKSESSQSEESRTQSVDSLKACSKPRTFVAYKRFTMAYCLLCLFFSMNLNNNAKTSNTKKFKRRFCSTKSNGIELFFTMYKWIHIKGWTAVKMEIYWPFH